MKPRIDTVAGIERNSSHARGHGTRKKTTTVNCKPGNATTNQGSSKWSGKSVFGLTTFIGKPCTLISEAKHACSLCEGGSEFACMSILQKKSYCKSQYY